ncbi:MAG: SDR family oxidoreductase, partial [Bryobacteraceae bacterium]|nr:SDR family oxidoreductase [Bryobacteraceae bacterium]
MTQPLPLDQRIAVVTGASRGLGRAIAVALAQAGARVACVGRDVEKLDETARLCGPGAHIVPADVIQEDEVSRLAAHVAEHMGPANILVNNAGVNLRKPVTEFTLEEWRWVIDSNLTSAFLCARAFIPQMIRS